MDVTSGRRGTCDLSGPVWRSSRGTFPQGSFGPSPGRLSIRGPLRPADQRGPAATGRRRRQSWADGCDVRSRPYARTGTIEGAKAGAYGDGSPPGRGLLSLLRTTALRNKLGRTADARTRVGRCVLRAQQLGSHADGSPRTMGVSLGGPSGRLRHCLQLGRGSERRRGRCLRSRFA
jgi:hypothetical protein